MECFIVEAGDVTDSCVMLKGDEARHAARSLRMRIGERILVTNLDGVCYKAIIDAIEDSGKQGITITCSIEEAIANYNEPSVDVLLIQAILNQPSKFEEIAERCTEIGIKSIAPMMTERVERNNLKVERIEKIVRSACKQSQRARKPTLLETLSLQTALTKAASDGYAIFLLHETADPGHSLARLLGETKSSRIALAIGPEGGFTALEVALAESKYGVQVVSLGKRRLRAETAAIAAVAIAMNG